MNVLEDTSCCGVDEITSLNSKPEQTLLEVCEDKYSAWGDGAVHAFLIFTDAVKYKHGAQLEKYIIKHKLGTIYKTAKSRRNPNSGNQIMVYIWAPNERTLKRWYKANKDNDD